MTDKYIPQIGDQVWIEPTDKRFYGHYFGTIERVWESGSIALVTPDNRNYAFCPEAIAYIGKEMPPFLQARRDAI